LGTQLKKLEDLVYFPNLQRRSWSVDDESKCISVLHVGNFGILDIKEIMGYRPKTAGQPCKPGDIIFSKINPRIPRVAIVPDLGCPLTCSTEFEVMRSRDILCSY